MKSFIITCNYYTHSDGGRKEPLAHNTLIAAVIAAVRSSTENKSAIIIIIIGMNSRAL